MKKVLRDYPSLHAIVLATGVTPMLCEMWPASEMVVVQKMVLCVEVTTGWYADSTPVPRLRASQALARLDSWAQ